MTLIKYVQPVTVALTTLLLAPTTTFAVEVVRSVGGSNDPASIQAAVDAFRADLGEPLNPNVPGSFPTGRREINWDGVPDIFAAPNNLPPDFFNVNSPRGAVFSTPGSAVQVSANAGVAPIEFDTINPTYSSIFRTFSPQRLFTAIDSNTVEVNFFVPGTNTPALVSGFGSVFTDVDLVDSTTIEYFNRKGNLIFSESVEPGTVGDESLSFLGVSFDAPVVASVRITSGNSALGANIFDGGGIDLVVMDDFIYGEPQALVVGVPEPSSVVSLLAFSVFGTAYLLKRRKGS